jgi:hypothetical protein
MYSSGLSGELQATLNDFIHAAADVLRSELAGGAEVPFELAAHRGRGGAHATLYCYEPLTEGFIAERDGELCRLPEHAAAVAALEHMHGLERYLVNRGAAGASGIVARDMRSRTGAGAGSRAIVKARARAALRELLADVFEGRTDFELSEERVHGAIDRLQRAEVAGSSDTLTVVATLYGVAITSQELTLAKGLTICAADAPGDAPEAARAGEDGHTPHLLVSLVVEQGEESGRELALNVGVHEGGGAAAGGDPEAAAIGGAQELLKDLLRALRLFGDGRVALGELAWVRSGGVDGRWRTVALGAGGRPHGMLVVAAEQEDELRAFCNLVSRRSPVASELAWALRRFELGCERASAYEGLSDHLLALRALLEPEGPSSGLLAGRIGALCATPERRAKLATRITRALALEREVIAGTAQQSDSCIALAREVSDHLRALLRDMICGHLKPDLVSLADELLAPQEPTDAVHDDGSSLEEMLGYAGESGEVMDLFV